MKRSPSPRRIACLWLPHLAQELEQVAAALGAHSPSVEADTGSGTALYLEATGLAGLYRSEARWSRVVLETVWHTVQEKGRLGLAGSKFAAWVAAQTAQPEPGYQIITQADCLFLAPLPATWLPVSVEVGCKLQLLGLRTIGQFASLRETQVIEQFGPESLPTHRWARGLDDRPVLGRGCQVLEARYEFEVPENRRKALLEAAIRLARRASQGLPVPRDAWAIRRVELEAVFVEGKVWKRSAWLGDTPGPQTMRTLLGGLIEGLKGAGPGIAELGVRLLGWEPAAGKQLALFARAEADLWLEQTLQSLAKKHSPACVVQAEERDTQAPLAAERYRLKEWEL